METHKKNNSERLKGEEIYVGQLVKSEEVGYGTVLDKKFEQHQTPISLDYYCIWMVLILSDCGDVTWYDVDFIWFYPV